MFKTLLALILLSVSVLAAASGLAQVTGVKGAVVLTRAGQNTPCGIFASLQAGDKVQVPDSGQVTLFFFGDNHRETISGPIAFSVTAAGTSLPPARKTVTQTPAALKVAGGSLVGLNSDQFGGSTKRGGDAPPIKLLNGPNVLETTPTLRWDAVPKATAYTVEVEKDFGDAPFISATTDTPSYTLTQPLPRGQTCVVKIAAQGTSTTGTTMLQVLSQAQAEPLLSARKAAESDDDPSAWVALAARYLHEGLTAETVDVLQVLADKAPTSPYPHERMAVLYQKAGLPAAAAAELKRAQGLTP